MNAVLGRACWRFVAGGVVTAVMAFGCATPASADWLGDERRLTTGAATQDGPQLSGTRLAYAEHAAEHIASDEAGAESLFDIRVLDLKTGVVIAQTSADLVDPYHQGALGNIASYDGGDSRRHDLGIELDFGANVRIPVDTTATVQAGVEGGVLFPGHAFDDVAGVRLANQYLVNLALGLQF